MKNIFLCGFMGVGKTYKGKRLARNLQIPFIDLDEEIVKRENMRIPEIFSKYGEGGFRDIETRVLNEVCCENKVSVISTGGGVFTRAENADIMRSHGQICYLNADFELCYRRIHGDQNRPIASEKSKSELKELFNVRHMIYSKNSDFLVDANKSSTHVVEQIKNFVLNK